MYSSCACDISNHRERFWELTSIKEHCLANTKNVSHTYTSHTHTHTHTHWYPSYKPTHTHTHTVSWYLAGLDDWTSCVTWRTNSIDTPSAKSYASGNFDTSSRSVYLAQFLQKRGSILYNCFSFSTGFSISLYWPYTCTQRTTTSVM